MPDRYGQRDDDDQSDGRRYTPMFAENGTEPLADRERNSYEIADCVLCDGDGLRNGFACDHIDWAPIAKRGIAKVRAALRKEAP